MITYIKTHNQYLNHLPDLTRYLKIKDIPLENNKIVEVYALVLEAKDLYIERIKKDLSQKDRAFFFIDKVRFDFIKYSHYQVNYAVYTTNATTDTLVISESLEELITYCIEDNLPITNRWNLGAAWPYVREQVENKTLKKIIDDKLHWQI